jgi:uncharacterized membrane protein YqhA
MAVYLAFKEVWHSKGRFLLIGLIVALITTLVLFIAATVNMCKNSPVNCW